MIELDLEVLLLSDATFGRGDGVAGLVDAEVEYEESTGLPFIRGRTLKGLLTEECANLLYALALQNGGVVPERVHAAARQLFGRPGSLREDDGLLRVGSALLPHSLRAAVQAEIDNGSITPADALEALSSIRRQTAIDEQTGVPETNSLRAQRVVLRQTLFCARLSLLPGAKDEVVLLAVLSACVASLHRGGLGRNRGRGRLKATLYRKTPERSTIDDAWEAVLFHERPNKTEPKHEPEAGVLT